MRIGFDNDQYIALQAEHIRNRIDQFGGKLYLEFGGKLFDDYHASRVLPGFEPDSKIRMLKSLIDDAEIIIAINANDIEKSKVRGDLGITYDEDVLRLMDIFRGMGFATSGVVITHYTNQPSAEAFRKRLDSLGIRSYLHYPIPGYPYDIDRIVSDEGYGRNEFIETTRPLVVVTAPGPGSGKMATCLSQLYHEHKRGVAAGYAKYETFPIWNLPLKHPVNIAYEAATVDLNDANTIDPFHLEAYGETTVNYNRDVEIFPVLKAMMERISGESPYQSPTDMGVNMAGNAIVDDEAVREAAKMEIVRRYFQTAVETRRSGTGQEHVEKLELLMNQAGVNASFSPARSAALLKEETTGGPVGAMVLPDGSVVTGKTSSLLGAASSLMMNALKGVSGVDDEIDVISDEVIEPICRLKTDCLHSRNPRLHSDETLIRHRPACRQAHRAHRRPARLRRVLLGHHLVHRREALPHPWHQRLLRAQVRAAPVLPQVRRRAQRTLSNAPLTSELQGEGGRSHEGPQNTGKTLHGSFQSLAGIQCIFARFLPFTRLNSLYPSVRSRRRMSVPAVSALGWRFFREECSPMNAALEILNAYAAIATIASFFLALWTNHKNADEAGREPGDGKGRD